MVKLTTVRVIRLLPAMAAMLLLLAAQTVYAADIRVEGDCNLYDAISAANTDSAVGKCVSGHGDDTIFLTRDFSSGRLPNITSNILVEGNHHDIKFGASDLAFRVENARLILTRLNINYSGQRDGNVIYVVDGALTLIDSSVDNCTGSVFLLRSQATVHSDTDICDLPSYLMFTGSNSDVVRVLATRESRSTCEALPGTSVSATLGLKSGVQCNQVDSVGIGNQAIVDGGYIDAVDVWGYVEQGVDICFAQLGSIIFLDAATSPRSIAPVDSYRSGNSTCASLTRPGTVVLVAGEAPSVSQPTETTTVADPATTTTTVETTVSTTATVPSQAGPVPDGCPIITTGNLKLRAEPSLEGEILGYVLRGSSLDVIARTTYWFQVNYQGVTGWIGQLYVAPAGTCA